MAETPTKSRRWNGFVCPDCRYIFRVAQNHDGRGVVCPACRRLLRLPEEGDRVPPLMIPGQQPVKLVPELVGEEENEEKVEEESGSGEGKVKRRRRKRSKKTEEVFDETFADKQEENPALIRGVIASLVVVGVIVAVALLWPKWGDAGGQPTGGGGIGLGVVAPVEDPDEVAAEERLVEPVLIEKELVPIYRKFLASKTVEEMAEWVDHPELALPRMKAYYADGFSSKEFKKVIWNPFNHRNGDWVTVAIEDEDFDQRVISARKSDGWKIDWESWMGWSQMSWPELREKRPEEGQLFRVKVKEVKYYNFSFLDEEKWKSYVLESPDGEDSVYGYVARGGELDARLQSDEMRRLDDFLIKIRFPEGAPSDNQVLIDEVVAEGWLDTRDKS